MNKLLKIRGFVALPIIIGSAVLAVGILGGLAYEFKDKLTFSGVDKNSLLASAVDLIQNAELNRIKFSAIGGQEVRLSEVAFKLTSGSSNLQDQRVTLYDLHDNQVGQIFFTPNQNFVASSSILNFVIPNENDYVDGLVVLKVKGTIVSGSSVKIDYVSSKGTGQFSGNTIWGSSGTSYGATVVTFNSLEELNRINFSANGQIVRLTDVALKLESGSPSNLKDQSVSLYFNNNQVGQAFFTAGNLVATTTLVGEVIAPTGGSSATLIIKGITNSPSVNVKYVASKAVGYSSGNTLWDSSSGATAVTFTTIIPTCASFAYSNWEICQSNGSQTRNVISSSPSGCTGGNPATSQTCSYVAPVVACTSFIYSDWSTCQSNSTQYRSVTSSGPSGCIGGAPVTTQSCSYSVSQPTTQTQQTPTVQQTTAQTPVTTQSQSIPTTQAVQQPTTSAVGSQSSTSYIQDLIAKLMEQIKSIQQQLNAQQSQSAASSVVPSTTNTSSLATPTETIPASEDIAPAIDNQTELFSYIWNRDLYYGLTNDKDVEALQNVLVMESCYTGPVTGNFYRLTRAGVICFQKKHNFTNIPGTGYIGSYTRRVLNELYSK